jgi:hypothetical protein
MAPDVLDDQHASRVAYERLRGDGFGDLVIPVWQARPAWDATLDATTNGRLASREPILRTYADRAPMVAIGGLVHGPCPRAERHRYLAQLVRAFPDTHVWALGQLVGDVTALPHNELAYASVSRKRPARRDSPAWHISVRGLELHRRLFAPRQAGLGTAAGVTHTSSIPSG